jgi:putative transcriptional regulator
MSQADFAHRLYLTPGYISQLERGVKRPTGATLTLLRTIQRNGIEVVP